MIKLFLITLLCATLVVANSPGKDSQDSWKPNGFVSRSDHLGHGSLVRRSAQGGGAGGHAGGGFGFNAGMGGGAGAGAGAGK